MNHNLDINKIYVCPFKPLAKELRVWHKNTSPNYGPGLITTNYECYGLVYIINVIKKVKIISIKMLASGIVINFNGVIFEIDGYYTITKEG